MNGIYVLRSLLGMVAGIAIGLPATVVLVKDMPAVVLGSLAAAAVAGPREIKTAVFTGSFTGKSQDAPPA